ncbi:hypothetical protein FOZ63_033117 [Perkinsus olseni]|uniref:Uncharacterized protein n=1 Tax=Perkinsus olseni TaxID=32597 RepID=A0A7J6QR27_PEROL|nr:hypothetical protein FOZ63_033117 [Perkinsus olseni]
MLHQLVISLFSTVYSLLSVVQPVQQPAGVYSGSINLEGRRYAATVTFSETDAVIEHLKIACPSGLETTLYDAPYTINDPHFSGPFVGFVLINDARFLVAATFSQDGSVIGDLIIDFHGLEPIVASDVPYKMIGAKVEISRASTLSEIFDRLNAELEYKKGIITFKVYGAGILSVTMQPASISRLLRR